MPRSAKGHQLYVVGHPIGPFIMYHVESFLLHCKHQVGMSVYFSWYQFAKIKTNIVFILVYNMKMGLKKKNRAQVVTHS